MQTKYKVAALTGMTAFAVWLLWRKHVRSLIASGEIIEVKQPQSNAFAAPYYTTVPGISDDGITLNGGAPFQSVINVNVNPSVAQYLNQHYIPLFGFVGMTVVNVAKTIPQPEAFIPGAPRPANQQIGFASGGSQNPNVYYDPITGFGKMRPGERYLSSTNAAY